MSKSLLEAAESNDIKTVIELCNAGADINETNTDGEAPIHIASQEGHKCCK